MKSMKKNRCGLGRGQSITAAAAMAAAAALTSASNAATRTWSGLGGDANWQTPANWDALPVANDLLQFGGTTNLATTNNFLTNTQFNGINFLAGAGAFTLGGNGILLGGDINNNSGVAQVINFTPTSFTFNGLTYATGGLVLDGGTRSVNVSAGGSLALGQVTFGIAPQSTNVSTLNINNSVSASGLTVQTRSSSNNIINVAEGQTFTIAGSVYLGTPATVDIDPDVQIPTNVNFTGGGNVAVTSGNFYVGLGSQNFDSGDRNMARVDMTALNSFSYTGGANFGVGWATRPDGQLRLASGSNTITAATLGVGNSGLTGTGSSPNNSSQTSRLFLGTGTNNINATQIDIGNIKGAGSIEWHGSTGSVTFAGLTGGASTTNITIGRQSSATGTSTVSQLVLAGHDALVQTGTVTIGHLNGAGGATASGLITFDTGSFNVNTLNIARNQSGTNPEGVRGTFTLGSNANSTGVLNVNTAFFLGNDTNATGGPTLAAFVINGGTANINTNIQVALNGGLSAGDAITMTLNGGTLNMNGNAIATAASPIQTVDMPGAGEVATIQQLGGTGINVAGVNMDVAGTLRLAGANTYTGATTISNGTLSVVGSTPAGSAVALNAGNLAGTGTVNDLVTMAGGAGIRPGDTGADGQIGTLTVANLDVNGGDLRFDLTSGGNDLLNVTGTANFNAGATASVAPVGLAAGTYTVLTAGTLTNASNLTLSSATVGRSGLALDFATANTVKLVVTGGAANLLWRGDDGTNPGLWDIETTQNWNNISAAINPDKYFENDNVTFGESSTNRTVTLNTTVSPGGVNFTHTTGSYTFTGAGAIGGGAGLTVSGGAAVVMPLSNSYTGVTTISNGSTLEVNNLENGGVNSPIGAATSASANLVINGGTLKYTLAGPKNTDRGFTLGTGTSTIELSNPNPSVAGVTFTGAIAYTGSGARTFRVAAADADQLNAQSAHGFTGVIADGPGGATTLVKDGNGSVGLSGINTYSGGTTINGGRIRVGNTSAFGSGAVTIASGGQAYLGASGVYSNDFTIAGTGYPELAGSPDPAGENYGAVRLSATGANLAGTVTLAADARITPRLATGATISGNITGPHNIEFGPSNADNILMLSNTTNDWTGNTIVSNGILRAGASSTSTTGVIPHGAGMGNVVVNGHTLSATNSVLDVFGNNVIVNGLSASGDVNKAFVASNTGSGTITVGDNNTTSTFAGILRDGTTTGILNYNKIGTGTHVLAGASTHTGTTTVSAGTLAIASTGSINTSNTIAVNSGATLDVSAVSGFTVHGIQALNANGTVTGPITLNGILAGSSTGNAGAVTMNGGSSVRPGATIADGVTGTLNMNSLDVGGGDFRLDLTSGGSDLVNVTGTANINAGASITVAPGYTAGTYTVLTAGTLNNAGNLFLTTTQDGRVNFALDTATANTVKVNITGAPLALTWNNSGAVGDGTTWDVQNQQNWKNGVNNEIFYNSDSVTFNDTNNGQYNVNVSGTVTPNGVTVNNSAGDYTFSGSNIAGSGGLTKLGTSTLILNNSNTYTGGTTISAGTINAAGSTVFGTGAVTLNGGALNLANAGALDGTQTLATGASGGTFDNTTGGAVSLTNPVSLTGTLSLPSSNEITFAGVVSGTGGLAKSGAATVVLSGANTFTGPVSITNGIVRAGNAAAFGTNAGGVTISGGGTFDLNGTALNSSELFTISGTGVNNEGVIVNNGAGAGGNHMSRVTLAGNASVGGTGRWDFRGNAPVLELATHTLTKVGLSQQVSVVAGSVQSTGGPGNIDVQQGIFSLETTTTMSSDVTVTFQNNTVAQFFRNTGNGTSTGLLGKIVVNGAVDMGNGDGSTTQASASVFSPIELKGALTLVPLSSGARAEGNTGAGLILAGSITEDASPRSITKIGNDTVQLTAANSYTGGTTISAGTLRLTGAGTAGSGPIVTDSTLQVYNNNALGAVSGTGTTTIGDGATGVTVSAAHLRSSTLAIAAGSIAVVNTNGGAAGVSRVTTLTVGAGSKLDLKDNDLVVDYSGTSEADNVRTLLTSGYNAGGWNGATGILTSVAGTDKSIGYGEASLVKAIGAGQTADFSGQTVDDTTILVKFTYNGDATLDGQVDIGDLGLLAGNWNQPANMVWTDGDFTYDGGVTIADLGLLAGNWNAGIGNPLAPPVGVTAVPEPAAGAILALACSTLLRRRRRS